MPSCDVVLLGRQPSSAKRCRLRWNRSTRASVGRARRTTAAKETNASHSSHSHSKLQPSRHHHHHAPATKMPQQDSPFVSYKSKGARGTVCESVSAATRSVHGGCGEEAWRRDERRLSAHHAAFHHLLRRPALACRGRRKRIPPHAYSLPTTTHTHHRRRAAAREGPEAQQGTQTLVLLGPTTHAHPLTPPTHHTPDNRPAAGSRRRRTGGRPRSTSRTRQVFHAAWPGLCVCV